jgi:hypothetical protein
MWIRGCHCIKKRPLRGAYYLISFYDQPNGLSPKGLLKAGSSYPGLSRPLPPPPPLGGGLGGVTVIITREIELSKATLVTEGLVYFFSLISLSRVFNLKALFFRLRYKNSFNIIIRKSFLDLTDA